jgi:hypothetical protein
MLQVGATGIEEEVEEEEEEEEQYTEMCYWSTYNSHRLLSHTNLNSFEHTVQIDAGEKRVFCVGKEIQNKKFRSYMKSQSVLPMPTFSLPL